MTQSRSTRATAAVTQEPVPAPGVQHLASQPLEPTHRLLRGYAFDPTLATQLETALVSEITYKIPWEKLDQGPVGEYIEVVDYDPRVDVFTHP